MAKPRLLPRHGATVLQLGLIASAIAALCLAPPATGRILLVPLSTGAARAMLPQAIARGARLVGDGPLPGSFVVSGDRAALAGPLATAGVALLAAPAAGCGR